LKKNNLTLIDTYNLWYDGLEVDYLSGNFDLMIQSTCNLHCKNCSILDWKGNEYPGQTMKLEDVININEKLIKLGIIVYRLTLLGGEPTLNKDIIKIIKYLSEFKNITFKELKLITNGLYFKKDIIKSFEDLDSLRISIYPYTLDMKKELIRSPLYKHLLSITDLEVMEFDQFICYGVEDPKYDYSKELNWERCLKKDWCRHLTVDGLYRCDILENLGQEFCDMSDKNKVIDYIKFDVPYDYCEKCPQPALFKPWQSNNPEVDKRNAKRGISLIQEWNCE
jgi:hypothetical protein